MRNKISDNYKKIKLYKLDEFKFLILLYYTNYLICIFRYYFIDVISLYFFK